MVGVAPFSIWYLSLIMTLIHMDILRLGQGYIICSQQAVSHHYL